VGSSRSIGGVYLLREVWEKWRLSRIVDKYFKGQFKGMGSVIIRILTLNRLVSGDSDHATVEWYKELSGLKYIEKIDEDAVYHQKFYRYVKHFGKVYPDMCKDIKRQIERIIHKNKKINTIFYDLTSTYFESGYLCIIAKYGYSRDKRKDKKQVVLGVVTDKYGFPIYSEVMKGNTKDSTTIEDMVEKLKNKFGFKDCVLVGDRGLITNDNFAKIPQNGLNYLMALDRGRIKISLGKKLIDKLSIVKKDTIILKEIEGAFYIIKLDTAKRMQKKKTREENLNNIKVKLDNLSKKIEEKRYKLKKGQSLENYVGEHIGRIKEKHGHSRYLSWSFDTKAEKLDYSIDKNLQKKEEKLDGLFVLRTNKKELKRKSSISLYKTLTEVEKLFKNLKSVLKVRPINHHEVKYVVGHIYISIFAYLIENYISFILVRKGINKKFENILPHLQNITISALKVDGKEIKKTVSEFTDFQNNILKHFNITKNKIEKAIVG